MISAKYLGGEDQLDEVRARQRLSEIRPLGKATDSDDRKSAFPPYEELPEIEKQDDRNTAIETLNLLLRLGYRVEPAGQVRVKSDGDVVSTQAAQSLDQIALLNLSSLLALWHGRARRRTAN